MGLAQKMNNPVIDKFTNDTTFSTKIEKIAVKSGSIYNNRLEAYFSKSGRDINLHFIVELPTTEAKFFRISAGSRLIIKLTDDSLITLTNPANLKSIGKEISGGTLGLGLASWVADITLPLSNNDVEKLSHNTVAAVRVQTDKSTIDFFVDFKHSGLFQKMTLLIKNAK
ncbi:MAG TPA: hypothetical protein VJ844_07145 [Mucilaginibacter sp.]|nr:hypothetical protein [Mucilaginibacter sp.]